jgi:1-aminocyclopropane-1-carboxylate deaminase
MFEAELHIKNQQVFLPELERAKVQLFVKREDEIHPDVSGNKFRKLKYNLQAAKTQGLKKIVTFGGAFSNHILATAVAGKHSGLTTIGVIRGEELGVDLEKTLQQNSTLQKAYKNGMQFVFVSREAYRQKKEAQFLKNLKDQFGDFYLIPEGGTNTLAVQGCEEILTNEDQVFDYICCCAGTGGTVSGLINTATKHQEVLGFPALKGDFLAKEIEPYITGKRNWKLIMDYHFGGYAKYQPELIHFINRFKEKTKIPLGPVYTGKMMFGILEMIQKGQFKEGSSILAIHTGGLQGIQGFNNRILKKDKNLPIIL